MDNQMIADFISDQERIVRSIYSPFCVDSKDNIKPAAFKCPRNLDEISVNRLDLFDENGCKTLALSGVNPSHGKTYWGLACLKAEDIRRLTNIISSPLPENPYHSDIKTCLINEEGVTNPVANKIANVLAKVSIGHKDSFPSEPEWKDPPCNYKEI